MSRRVRAILASVLVLLGATATEAGVAPPTIEDLANAVTELDVERARTLLGAMDSRGTAVAIERARLSLFIGDCDTAGATLRTLTGVKSAGPLAELAKNCARATAGSLVVEDAARGIWVRLQDAEDRVLVPFLADVAGRARDAIQNDLGVVMPRPLRIDLVRDLFSLSAVSGLPLQAAETTGTVAVARWGRVNMISPRAAPGGYPWQDTLAHEITHLALSRATRDAAPLWLQEGLAKREETRWRDARPFDHEPRPDDVAKNALIYGESVGVDKLGPSIAMLPSADAATIAFAEVTSFVQYFVHEKGKAGLMLLFADLKGLGSEAADRALVSTSGYDLGQWIRLWQAYLLNLPANHFPEATPEDAKIAKLIAEEIGSGKVEPLDARARARSARLGELLFSRGHAAAAVPDFQGALAANPADPSLRWRFGRSLIAAGREEAAAPLFDSIHGIESAHPGWFGLAGRFAKQAAPGGRPGTLRAEECFEMAVGLNPYLDDAACEGHFAVPQPAGDQASSGDSGLPAEPRRRDLCESARKIPSDW
jgi:Peptidase MA superfamily